MYLFYLGESEIELIGLKLNTTDVNLTTKEGFAWLRENLMSDDVEIFDAKKAYSNDKQLDKFALIQQGSVITKGELFTYFDKLIH